MLTVSTGFNHSASFDHALRPTSSISSPYPTWNQKRTLNWQKCDLPESFLSVKFWWWKNWLLADFPLKSERRKESCLCICEWKVYFFFLGACPRLLPLSFGSRPGRPSLLSNNRTLQAWKSNTNWLYSKLFQSFICWIEKKGTCLLAPLEPIG